MANSGAARELHSLRLHLRPMRRSDHGEILAMVSEWDVVRMTARWPFPAVPAMVDELIEKNRADPARGYAIGYGRRCAGIISAGPDIGYMIASEFWGLGIMTEALWAVQRDAVKRRGHRVLRAKVYTDNPASMAVLRKCGWQAAGQGQSDCRARGAVVEETSFEYREVKAGESAAGHGFRLTAPLTPAKRAGL